MNSEEKQLLLNINKKVSGSNWTAIVSIVSAVVMMTIALVMFVKGPFTEIWDEFKLVRKEIKTVAIEQEKKDNDHYVELDNKIIAHQTLDDEIMKINNNRLISVEKCVYKHNPEDRDYLRDPKLDPYPGLNIFNLAFIYGSDWKPWSQFNCLIKQPQRYEFRRHNLGY